MSVPEFDRERELARLAVVLDRGLPMLEAWEVGLLIGSGSSTKADLGRAARKCSEVPPPAIKNTTPKWAPGAIKAFLAGEWTAPTIHDRIAGLRAVESFESGASS